MNTLQSIRINVHTKKIKIQSKLNNFCQHTICKKKEKRKINYFPLTFDIQSCFNSVF